MLRVYFLFFLLCHFIITNAQESEIESIKQTLKTNLQDTTQVNQLNRLAFLYHDLKPDTTLILAQQAISIAVENRFIRGEARGLSLVGASFRVTGNFSKALEKYLQSLKKYEQINDLEGVAKSTGNISNIYSAMGNYKQSEKYLLRALRIFQQTKNRTDLMIALANLGSLYFMQNKLDSARTYTLKAYDMAINDDNLRMIRGSSALLGHIYAANEQLSMAMEYYKIGFDKHTVDVINSNIALAMARISKKRKQSDSTLYYARHAFNLANNGGFTSEKLEASTFLSEYYKNNRNIDSAYFYLKATLAAKDSLFDQEKRNKVQALAIEENVRQEELRNSLQEIKKKKTLNLTYLGITAVIIGLILVFLLLSRSIIVGEKWLGFLGIFILLLVFEFLNLYLSPIISEATNSSPLWTFLIMVTIAVVLVPLHHKIEKFITKKILKKNRKIKISVARRVIKKYKDDDYGSKY